MTNDPNYKAKQHYQSGQVAQDYDDERFQSWYGGLAHEIEANALTAACKKHFPTPGKLLDLPCGTGRLFPVMLEQGHQVTGGDISEEMMGIAKKRFETNPQVNFKKTNAESLDFEDNTFNYLTSYRLMCHLPHDVQDKVLQEMIRVTKDALIINYHVTCLSPLYLFNLFFRKQFCSPYPLKMNDLVSRLRDEKQVELVEIKKLSWYERSSVLVALKKVS